MDLFDLLEKKTKPYSKSFNVPLDRLEELEIRVNESLNIPLSEFGYDDLSLSLGESLYYDPSRRKPIEKLFKEWDELIQLEIALTDKKRQRRVKRMKSALMAKVESRKFISGKKFNQMKWKKNTPYLLFHEGGATVLGAMVSYFTMSPFSHVEIWLDGKSYTAYDSKDGVNLYDVSDKSNVIVYELHKDFNPAKIKKFMEKTRGTKYGKERIIKSLVLQMGTPGDRDKFDQFFCSHWVMSALDYASNKTRHFEGKTISQFGYDRFTPTTVFNWMVDEDDVVVSKRSLTMPDKAGLMEEYLNINNNLKAFGESVSFPFSIIGLGEEDEIPSGELTEEGPADEPEDIGSEDTEDNMDFDDSGEEDYGFEDEGSDESNSQIEDPLKDVEDSDKSLVKNLRKNMATFYYSRESDLEKILSSNVATSDYGEEAMELIESYKSTLSLFEEYLRETFDTEATSRKVLSFVKYKSLFNRLNESFNKFFSLIGSDVKLENDTE